MSKIIMGVVGISLAVISATVISLSSNTDTSQPPEPTPVVQTIPTEEPSSIPLQPTATNLIDDCYHLDSCGYYKITKSSLDFNDAMSRFYKVDLVHGFSKSPTNSETTIKWDSNPKTYWVLCSLGNPRIGYKIKNDLHIEDLDLINGVNGASAGLANIYQAVCHNLYNNELADNEYAMSMGYMPLNFEAREYNLKNVDEVVAHYLIGD